jgi:hypothetical protein
MELEKYRKAEALQEQIRRYDEIIESWNIPIIRYPIIKNVFIKDLSDIFEQDPRMIEDAYQNFIDHCKLQRRLLMDEFEEL